jgi:hypothetical protein
MQTKSLHQEHLHKTNWTGLLCSSGITPRLVPPSEGRSMPAQHSLGLTNIQ